MARCDWSFPFFGDRDLSGVHRLINSGAFPLLYSNPVQPPPREPSMSVDAGSGRCPCPWTWMGFKVSPNPPHSGILGLSRAVDVPGKGPGQTEPFPTGAQPHPSANPLQFSILHKDPQSQTEGKKNLPTFSRQKLGFWEFLHLWDGEVLLFSGMSVHREHSPHTNPSFWGSQRIPWSTIPSQGKRGAADRRTF